MGRGCTANHARRRSARCGLGRGCWRGALNREVIRIGFADLRSQVRRAGDDDAEPKRASVRNVRGKRVDGSFWSLPHFSFLFFHTSCFDIFLDPHAKLVAGNASALQHVRSSRCGTPWRPVNLGKNSNPRCAFIYGTEGVHNMNHSKFAKTDAIDIVH
jgi:hypothetical protein